MEDLRTWFGSPERPIRAVDGLSFSVNQGRTVALVGESGCGKSVTALSLARLVQEPPGFYAGGHINFEGRSVLDMDRAELSKMRGRDIAYIFQEPGSALNPVFRVGDQIKESLKLHRPGINRSEEAISLLTTVGLPDPEKRVNSYPHELSGGQQQRVMIAMALACRPRLLVADEPTTALDVTIQAQILELLADLQRQFGMAILIITHNLGLVAEVADFVNIMYAGRIVEAGPTEPILISPAHPYTKALLDAVPRLDAAGKTAVGIKGAVPHPANLPAGCKFAPRCSRARHTCTASEPELLPHADSGSRTVRCYFPWNS